MEALHVRIPRSLYECLQADLARPHAHAYERVGFLSSSLKRYADGSALVLISEYQPVDDADYVPDETVGARIGANAIRAAMQWSKDTQRGLLHVHEHPGRGIPGLSFTDRRELPPLVTSLRRMTRDQAYGIFLLSQNACACWVWLPGNEDPVAADRITVVGQPMALVFPSPWQRPRTEARFSRQTFLGTNALDHIRAVRVGVVGLGGGGSHIVQQLAYVGVRHFDCFDEDRVEESNLNRLVGATAADAAQQVRKTQVAERLIQSITPDAAVAVHSTRWQEHPEALERCDLVFGCVDSFVGRRELEAHCRRYLIPYIDIGMDVNQVGTEPPVMAGQVILSLPGYPCMQCIGFLNDAQLSAEVAQYGQAGPRPQVVWPNGVLASSAVGIGMDLLTDWTGNGERVVYLMYNGNTGHVSEHPRMRYLQDNSCLHYALQEVGPPRWHSPAMSS